MIRYNYRILLVGWLTNARKKTMTMMMMGIKQQNETITGFYNCLPILWGLYLLSKSYRLIVDSFSKRFSTDRDCPGVQRTNSFYHIWIKGEWKEKIWTGISVQIRWDEIRSIKYYLIYKLINKISKEMKTCYEKKNVMRGIIFSEARI